MQICSLVISEYNRQTTASEEVGCCFPEQKTRGKFFCMMCTVFNT